MSILRSGHITKNDNQSPVLKIIDNPLYTCSIEIWVTLVYNDTDYTRKCVSNILSRNLYCQ